MDAPTPYYRSYRRYLQDTFGAKIYKVTLDAGFTCPNIDGAKGRGGCTFCDETGSSSRAQNPADSLTAQIQQNIERQRARFGAEKFIAYFQSHTNTYAPAARLKALYDEALAAHPDVMGLAISTRPDCVDADKLDLIASYQRPDRSISVEYGMQTIHDATLARLNRCETHADFLKAYEMTRARDLDHTIHVILGLPGESHADMMASADALAALDVRGVKIHLLVAMEKTQLAKEYAQGRWRPMEQAEYVETVCDFIERLPPHCVIHRVAGNGHHQHVVAPRWMMRKLEVMNAIDAVFRRRGTRQGAACRTPSPKA
ncbi:MAG: TIGR01212 family radical SAM protein [Vampirovibrionales bacterium]|nr:TIGR01212 family radical SAM protein [Vampirovibrionales bacterium]